MRVGSDSHPWCSAVLYGGHDTLMLSSIDYGVAVARVQAVHCMRDTCFASEYISPSPCSDVVFDTDFFWDCQLSKISDC